MTSHVQLQKTVQSRLPKGETAPREGDRGAVTVQGEARRARGVRQVGVAASQSPNRRTHARSTIAADFRLPSGVSLC